jgi:hypothetical protein
MLLREDLDRGEINTLVLGGRIVLINALLNSIPVFFLSFLKIPIKVWREVVKFQRSFLWGGAFE